jgi:amino acid adenylation domain-containing protein
MPAESDLLKSALLEIRALRARLSASERAACEPIAIVGAGCRFPGNADSLEAYWQILRDGVDAVCPIPEERWNIAAYYDADPESPGKMYAREGGFLGDIKAFDADFFGISPREAVRLDPQQRLLLEVSWEAIENAAIAPERLKAGLTGVYTGFMSSDYALRQAHRAEPEELDPYVLTGNDPSFTAGRLSYFLGLQGPSMACATACSSSLVAIHLACQALRAGECEFALAGGVNVILDPSTMVMLSKLRALSKDGRSKTFDANADGYGRGEGCGMVVLEPLSKAIANGDRILAVIRGSAVNHDGPSAGLTVPNGVAQEKLLRAALKSAQIAPADVDYVEAHGTGTSLGDPIELQSIARALGAGRQKPLLVGSVKTNIGHLEAASGVAGLLKVVLSLAHREIPAHLHFTTPSPHVPWNELPLQVNAARTAWHAEGKKRIAGVSSFGLSGINAHVVIEEAPAPKTENAGSSTTARVLALSAKTPEALEELVRRYRALLTMEPKPRWQDVCFTANAGREHFSHRIAVVAESLEEAVSLLEITKPKSHRGQPRVGSVLGEDGDHAVAMRTGRSALQSVAELYMLGAEIDWNAFEKAYDDRPNRIALPTYPFQRQPYWAISEQEGVEAPKKAAVRPQVSASGSIPERLAEQVAVILGLPASPDHDRPLVQLGMDSLMSAELGEWIRKEWNVAVPPGELSAATIQTLAAAMMRLLPEAKPADIVNAAWEEPEQFPLSHGQRALWFIHQSAPENSAYNVAVALSIDQNVNAPALKQCFQKLADRHPALRTTISTGMDGEPLQEIHPRQAVAWRELDFGSSDREEFAQKLSTISREPFDLQTGPLFRVILCRRPDEKHVLLLVAHHIICDAFSFWTLLDELQNLYRAAVSGTPESLSPLAQSYASFVKAQREKLAGDEGERSWTYWKAELSGELPVFNLPTDFPRPLAQTFRGARHTITIPENLTGRLRELARRGNVTLYTALLAAFDVLLYRYTGQEEIIVGSATSIRPHDCANVVGYFVNPVPLRANLSGDPDFTAFLNRMGQLTSKALEHRDFPFPLLVERLQPRRDASRSPIFQVDFSLSKQAHAYRRGLQAATLEMEPFPLEEEEGQFELGLHVTEHADGLSAAFKFNRDLFTKETIERMAASFLALLEAITDNPSARISNVSILPAGERERVLALGQGVKADYPPVCVQEMFERQAERTPDAVAVEQFGTEAKLSYRDLNGRANQLAARLLALGVGPEVICGIHLERSPELVIAILAVLKAGGAYLPIDPSYPAERRAYMMRDAAVPVLLTSSKLASKFQIDGPAKTICLDTEWESIATQPEANLLSKGDLDQLAYVIYTSGSTGRPKGTLITHRGLTNYLCWSLDAYEVAAGSGAPLNLAIGFDATITSLFPPLLTGGSVVLLPEEEGIEALQKALISERQFSLVKITPAHLEMLGHMGRLEAFARAANRFVIGGEALRGDVVEQWRQYAPDIRLINEYGPTETVVGCCVYEVKHSITGSVPIGRPIANTSLYVLDGNRNPVPVGVAGELYIGGAGVARGYLNQPELTQSRFVPDPFAKESGARLYRTGDLVRYLPDGNLEFLGRADAQVKVRGYRIEPGEVESVLTSHPLVNEAAVVAAAGPDGSPFLACYFVPDGAAPAGAELHAYLAKQLPEYMVPAVFIPMEALPLTANGKLDRSALPRPVVQAMEVNFAAPRDSLEMQLAAIWEEVLDTRPIGIKQNFFDLGGHSLLAVKLMARIQQRFGAEISLSSILRAPTIEQLANTMRQNLRPASRSSLVPMQPAGNQLPFFCVPGAGGNTMYLYNLSRRLGPDQPFYGLQGVGLDGEAAPHTRVEEMAAHYLTAIQSVQPHGPYCLGGHSLGGWVAFEMAQLLEQAGEEVAVLAILDTPAPIVREGRDMSDWDNAQWIAELTSKIGQLLNPDLKLAAEELRGLEFTAQLLRFRDALTGAELFPRDAGLEHLEAVVQLFQAHSQVRYIAKGGIKTGITLLRTDGNTEALPVPCRNATWGWSSLGRVDLHIVPGEHLSMLRPPHVEALGVKLSECLTQSRSKVAVAGAVRG